MTDMAKISQAATDYTNLILAEYPDAVDQGLGVAVTLPDSAAEYVVTVTRSPTLPPAEDQAALLEAMSKPQSPDTPVSTADGS